MKLFCYLSLLLSYTLITATCSAQAREDDKIITLGQVSSTLTSATGWAKSAATGKWVSHKNYIGDENAVEKTSPSFRWMRTASFDYSGQRYYVWYYMAHAMAETMEADAIYYSIMSAAQYGKLMTALDHGGRAAVQVETYMFAVGPLNDESLARDISLKRLKDLNKKSFSRDSMYVDRQTIDGHDIVRFEPTASHIDGYFETDAATFRSVQLAVSQDDIHAADPEGRVAHAGEILDWQTSDTLYGRSCSIGGASPTLKPFIWAAVSSFVFEGKKMYVIYYLKPVQSESYINYLVITEPQGYAAFKATLAARNSDGADLTSRMRPGIVRRTDRDLQSAIVTLLQAQQADGRSCLSAAVGKNTAMFKLPSISCTGHNFKTGNTDYYECDAALFNKLLKLP